MRTFVRIVPEIGRRVTPAARIPATKRAALCWAIDQALPAYAS